MQYLFSLYLNIDHRQRLYIDLLTSSDVTPEFRTKVP